MYGGVQYNFGNEPQSVQYAEERAGASLLGYLYRFEWDRGSRCLKLIAYKICKKTPKGWRILIGPYSGERQVCDGTRRKFAAPTVEAALESYRARKQRYRSILQCQLDEADEMIAGAKRAEAFPRNDPAKKLNFLIGGEEFTA